MGQFSIDLRAVAHTLLCAASRLIATPVGASEASTRVSMLHARVRAPHGEIS
jgi:hypothetical protein